MLGALMYLRAARSIRALSIRFGRRKQITDTDSVFFFMFAPMSVSQSTTANTGANVFTPNARTPLSSIPCVPYDMHTQTHTHTSDSYVQQPFLLSQTLHNFTPLLHKLYTTRHAQTSSSRKSSGSPSSTQQQQQSRSTVTTNNTRFKSDQSYPLS